MNCEANAERAIDTAPGVLAVKADCETNTVTVGTKKNKPIPRKEILAALASIGYSGEFIGEAREVRE